MTALFGLATQDTACQTEARDRLVLPFELLSDAGLALTSALGPPTFEAGGETLIKRMLRRACRRLAEAALTP